MTRNNPVHHVTVNQSFRVIVRHGSTRVRSADEALLRAALGLPTETDAPSSGDDADTHNVTEEDT